MKLITFETDYICVTESDPSTSSNNETTKRLYNLMKQYT